MENCEHESSVKFAVVGAGFSGICMAATLKRSGLVPRSSGKSVLCVIDKREEVGGTWAANRYPGAACDVESPLYNLSFEPSAEWSGPFAAHSEIRSYLHKASENLDINQHLILRTSVSNAAWDSASSCWVLSLSQFLPDGEVSTSTMTARYLFLGSGMLSVPFVPEIPGLQEFPGKVMHSADWDESYDVTGKRVAVIGNAASAVQLVPKIQPKVSELGVIQRTPNYILHPQDNSYSDWARALWRTVPGALLLTRWFLYWRHDLLLVLPYSPLQRYDTGSFRDRLSDKYRAVTIAAMRSQCRPTPDAPVREDIAAKCVPEYLPGCKRILISKHYLPAICQPNVRVLTEGCARVTGRTVQAGDGSQMEDVDCIVLATGFVAGSLGQLRVSGEEGEAWSDRELVERPVDALFGVSTRHMPNLFLMYGPGTNLGHSSIVFMIECQANYIAAIIRQAEGCGREPVVRVKPQVLEEHNAWRRETLKSMVWTTSCPTWYKNKNGDAPLMWPTSCTNYWWQTRNPKCNDLYDVQVLCEGDSETKTNRTRKPAFVAPVSRL